MRTAAFDSFRSVDARNARDLARIERLLAAAADLLCAMAFIEPLQHPEAKFHPDDLRWPVRHAVDSLLLEQKRITAAVVEVLDDPDITADVVEATHYE